MGHGPHHHLLSGLVVDAPFSEAAIDVQARKAERQGASGKHLLEQISRTQKTAGAGPRQQIDGQGLGASEVAFEARRRPKIEAASVGKRLEEGRIAGAPANYGDHQSAEAGEGIVPVGPGDRLVYLRAKAPERRLGHGGDKGGAAGEVAKRGARGNAGAARGLTHAEFGRAALLDERRRRLHQSVAKAAMVIGSGAGRRVDHASV